MLLLTSRLTTCSVLLLRSSALAMKSGGGSFCYRHGCRLFYDYHRIAHFWANGVRCTACKSARQNLRATASKQKKEDLARVKGEEVSWPELKRHPKGRRYFPLLWVRKEPSKTTRSSVEYWPVLPTGRLCPETTSLAAKTCLNFLTLTRPSIEVIWTGGTIGDCLCLLPVFQGGETQQPPYYHRLCLKHPLGYCVVSDEAGDVSTS